MGACAFALWDIFHAQFDSTWSPDEAYAGNIEAQKRLASCYVSGCQTVPYDPAFSCAWRTIIANEEKRGSPSDITSANAACRNLSPSAREVVSTLVADIRQQIREDAEVRVQPRDKQSVKTPKALRAVAN
jgi:hypothetical protein